MKLSSHFTKIATLLLVSAKAVSGQCADGSVCAVAPIDPQYCTLLGIDPSLGKTYCDLYATSPENAKLYATVVFTSFNFDPTGVFLGTCLEDLLVASQLSSLNLNRRVCEDDKTEIALFTTVENSSIPSTSTVYNVVDGIVKNDVGWNTSMCKSASCDAGVLQQVITATWLDFFDLFAPNWRAQGWKATSTITPTATCVYDQIAAAVNTPELYCTADAPTCSNIKLAEIKLADDAPFEVAICDDNECLASVGAVDMPGYFATGTLHQSYIPQDEWKTKNDPFCITDLADNFTARNQKYISATISDKAFDKRKYCTVKAASKRAGKCTCANSATFEFKVEFSGKMEKCSWMTENPDAKKRADRIKKYCADTQTKFQCAKTCSNCRACVDDERHTFVLPNSNVGKTVNCSYITKNIKRTAIRKKRFCPVQGAACPKSCGYCPE